VHGAGFLAGVGDTTLRFGTTTLGVCELWVLERMHAVLAPAHTAGEVDVTAEANGESSPKGSAGRDTFS
jgi:hypothetical protein